MENGAKNPEMMKNIFIQKNTNLPQMISRIICRQIAQQIERPTVFEDY